MNIKEILDVDEFKSVKKEGLGYVAITDGNKCRLHIIMCPNVDLHYFKTKVIQNNRKNGRYYWSDNLSNLKSTFPQFEDCLHCMSIADRMSPLCGV